MHIFVQPWHPLQLFQHLKLLHATLSYCTTPVIDLDCINLKWNFLYPLSFPAAHQHTTPWTDKAQNMLSATFSFIWANTKIQGGARKTGPPSRRTTWAQVSDSLQEIKQMKMQSTYWLEKVLKMISLYVNALLCTLQHIVIHAMQLSGVNRCMTICCSVHKSALTYNEIVFCTFSNQ